MQQLLLLTQLWRGAELYSPSIQLLIFSLLFGQSLEVEVVVVVLGCDLMPRQVNATEVSINNNEESRFAKAGRGKVYLILFFSGAAVQLQSNQMKILFAAILSRAVVEFLVGFSTSLDRNDRLPQQ